MPSSTAGATRASEGYSRATRRWSVRTHLWLVAATAAVVLLGALAYGYVWGADQAQRQATASMQDHARIAAREVSEAVQQGLPQVAAVAAQPGIAAVLAGPTGCSLLVSGSEAFRTARLDIVGSTGVIGCSSDEARVDLSDPVHASADWFPAALADPATSVRWPAVDAVTGEPAVVVTRVFPDDSGSPAGLVALFLDVSDVAATLSEAQALPRDAALTVVDLDTRTVVSPAGVPTSGAAADRLASAGTAGRWVGPDGVERVFASAEVDGVPWRVYAGLDHASVVAAARGTVVRQGLAGGAALLLLLAALWFLGHRVAGPLRALTRAAVRARDDAGRERVPEAGTAELVELARAFNTMLDIRAGQEARLAYQASHDRLTGLPTTDWFRHRLDALLARTPVDGRLVVLSVGLNRFQAMTDAVGPEAAERILTEVATRVRAAVRPGDSLARSGTYEFLLACEDLTVDEAVELAEHLHLVIEAPMAWPAAGVAVQASTGIAVHRDAATVETLLREAVTAMAHAQSRTRTWSVFDESMRVRATHQLETEQGLRDALARDELIVHFQPIVETASGHVVGAEALVRWQHPERGLIPPVQFIGVAEQTGQIRDIGATVLRRACRQAALWARDHEPFVVSVNVAAAQLLDDGFAAEVAGVLAAAGLAPERLCLEVTESAVIRRAGSGAENLHRLRQLGVRVAVDDFGTGYSSLSYLQHLPITGLKIDRSFITRIENGGRDRHLVEAVLGMARALELAVTAEGVETAGQRALLAELGCPSAQGYLFGKPCDPETFAGLLRRRPAVTAA